MIIFVAGQLAVPARQDRVCRRCTTVARTVGGVGGLLGVHHELRQENSWGHQRHASETKSRKIRNQYGEDRKFAYYHLIVWDNFNFKAILKLK